MSSTPSIPRTEGSIKRLVRAASLHNDVKALKELRDLAQEDLGIFLKDILPVIWHRLSFETPVDVEEGTLPSAADIMVLVALDILNSKKEYENPGFMDGLRKHTMDIVNWVQHLNVYWLLRGDPSLRDSTGTYDHLWTTLLDILPCSISMLVNSGDEKILSLMRGESDVGFALAGLCLSSIRARKPNTILKEAVFYSHVTLTGEISEVQPWQQNFYYTAVDEGTPFVGFIMQFLDDCLEDTLSTFMDNVMIIIPFLERCISSGFHPLFSAFVRSNMIGRICRIAYRISASFQVLPIDAATLLSFIAQLLTLFYLKGGVSAVSETLGNRLIATTINIYNLTGPQEPKNENYRMLQGLFAQLLTMVTCLVVYPPIYSKASKTLRSFEPIIKIDKAIGDPGPICEALVLLAQRLLSEADIRKEIELVRRDPEHHNPYRFCDNVHCPYVEKGYALGRCVGCRKGYYCSRHCQQARWKAGHRKECKILRENLYYQETSVTPFHDEEYFRRTAIARYKYYHARLETKLIVNKNTTITLDLTTTDTLDMLTSETANSEAQSQDACTLVVTYPICNGERIVSFEFPIDVVSQIPQ